MMESIFKNKNRIEWVDIYKGLAILLVVIGHATPYFNNYIYTFHMAAFFFISGYTTSSNIDSVKNLVVKKIVSILVPFCGVNVAFYILRLAFSFSGWENIFYHNHYTISQFFSNISTLFTSFSPIDLLGATWFLLVLFYVYLLFSLFLIFNDKKIDYKLVIFSLVIYFLGYLIKDLNFTIKGVWDLAFIAQIYFFTGIFLKKKNILGRIGRKFKNFKYVLCFVFCVLFFYVEKLGVGVVNFPTRYFQSPVFNYFIAFLGIMIVYSIAIIISDFKFYFKKIFIVIGQKTLPILFFHFLFFRLFFLFLVKLNIVGNEQLFEIVPLKHENYWFLMVIFSVLMSNFLYKLISKNRFFRAIIFGEEVELKTVVERVINIIFFNKYFCKFEKIILKITNFFKGYILKVGRIIKENQFLAVGIFFIMSLALSYFWRSFLIVDDELQAYMYASDSFKEYFTHFAYPGISQQGRPNVFGLVFQFLIFRTGNINFIKFMNLIIILGIGISISIFVKSITRNINASLFTFILYFLFLTQSWEPGFPNAYILYFGVSIGLLLISLITFNNNLIYNKKIYSVISQTMFVICLLTYELFIIYLPLYFLLAYINKKYLKETFKYCINYIFIIIGYFILFASIKLVGFGGSYSGAAISIETFSFSKFIYSTLKLSSTSLPGVMLIQSTYKYLLNYYHNFEFLGNYTKFLFALFSIKTLFLGIFSFIISKELIKKINFVINNKTFVVVSVFSLFYLIAPSAVLSLTPFYQLNVSNGMYVYVTASFLSFLVFLFYINFLIAFSKNKFFNKKLLTLLCAFFITIIGVNVSFFNDSISQYKERSYYKWELVDSLISSGVVDSVLESDYIIAPSLWNQIGSVGVGDSFWSEYFRVKLKKNINVIKDIKNLEKLEGANYFYIKYDQDLRYDEQYILFSEVGDNWKTSSDYIIGDKIEIFYKGKDLNPIIIGSILNHKNKSGFQSKIEKVNLYNGGIKNVIIQKDKIILDTVSILGQSHQELNIFENINNKQFVEPEILSLFPESINIGESFNIQADGSSAISVTGNYFTSSCSVLIGEEKINICYGNENWITFTIPQKYIDNAENISIKIINDSTGGISNEFLIKKINE